VIHYRDQETITVMVLKDRVTCIFSTLFTDADDIIIGKVFMQAFSDVRGKNPQAPQVLFKHKEAPEELAGTSALSGDNVGYITFGRLAENGGGCCRRCCGVSLQGPASPPTATPSCFSLVVLTPRHFQDKNKEETIDLIHTFRNYLHYHIKCSKAYLHQRMRARTAGLLKVREGLELASGRTL
jgi:actin related protein 2/3 complex subunit 2